MNVSIQHLVKRYKVGSGQFTALKDINLEFQEGEFSGLIGPSGSGKTTLLNIIGLLDIPSDGKAYVMGKSVAELNHRESAMMRNKYIGFIFQTHHLLPVYTVYENVEFPLLLQGMGAHERKKAVQDALEWVGLSDKAKNRPNILSGGESQRVAIARAMVKKPVIVLADEPSANLDTNNSHQILQTMKTLNKELGTTFIFSTHDEKVMQYLNRIIRLKDGQLDQDSLKA